MQYLSNATLIYVRMSCTHTAGPWGPVTPRFPLGPSVPYIYTHTCGKDYDLAM